MDTCSGQMQSTGSNGGLSLYDELKSLKKTVETLRQENTQLHVEIQRQKQETASAHRFTMDIEQLRERVSVTELMKSIQSQVNCLVRLLDLEPYVPPSPRVVNTCKTCPCNKWKQINDLNRKLDMLDYFWPDPSTEEAKLRELLKPRNLDSPLWVTSSSILNNGEI